MVGNVKEKEQTFVFSGEHILQCMTATAAKKDSWENHQRLLNQSTCMNL